MTPGTILFDPSFKFSDDSTGEKLLIILNNASHTGSFIFVKTTSNPNHKQSSYGCHLNDRHPNFCIPQGQCWFKKNTWICMDEFFEASYQQWLKDFYERRNIKQKGQLPTGILNDLLLCSMKSEDISPAQERALNLTLNSLD